MVLQQGEAALACIAQATQPNSTPQLGEVHQVRRPLLSANQNDTPAALSPLRRQNPREEPGALAAHAGICTGAAGNGRPYRDPRQPRQLIVPEPSRSLPKPKATFRMPFQSLGADVWAARVHDVCGRRGDCVAARYARPGGRSHLSPRRHDPLAEIASHVTTSYTQSCRHRAS